MGLPLPTSQGRPLSVWKLLCPVLRAAPQGMCHPSCWEVRLREISSLAQSHTVQQRQSWDSSANLTPGRLCPAPGPFSKLCLPWSPAGSSRERKHPASSPSAAAAPLPCWGLLRVSRKISFGRRFLLKTFLKHLYRKKFKPLPCTMMLPTKPQEEGLRPSVRSWRPGLGLVFWGPVSSFARLPSSDQAACPSAPPSCQ